MSKVTVYVEIELEVDSEIIDEYPEISREGWEDINRLEGLWDVMSGVVRRIGMPSRTRRSDLLDEIAKLKVKKLK